MRAALRALLDLGVSIRAALRAVLLDLEPCGRNAAPRHCGLRAQRSGAGWNVVIDSSSNAARSASTPSQLT